VDYKIRFGFASTAVFVAIAAVVGAMASTVVASRAYVTRGDLANRAEQIITVKGSTRKRIRSDQAVWYISVRGEHKELKETFAILDAGIRRVRAFLEEKGFAAGEIGMSAISMDEHHVHDKKGNATREISGYTLSRSFTVTTLDVDAVARAAGEVTQLIQEGVLVFSSPPSFYYSNLATLKVELMAAAAKDARLRADTIANETGCRVAEVRSAKMGVLQVTQPFSTEVSDWGTYDTSTIEKDVQAVVTVQFRIEAG